MFSFKKVNAYIEGKGIIKTNITFNDKIISVRKSMGEIISLPEDALVLPAFIDQHTHGAGGFDAMDGDLSALKTISETIAKEGTASYLATTITSTCENTNNALNAIKEYINSNSNIGAKLLGVHLEGPFISKKYKGAHKEEFVVNADESLFNEFNDACGKNIKIVTIAVEEETNRNFIKYLDGIGIVASIGHTNATYKNVIDAFNNGAKCVTHTYNAQSPLLHREIGTVGGALLTDGLYTEIIADLIHVSAPAIKLLLQNKPKDKVILITDSMRAKGLSDGESELGGQVVIVKNGEARLKDGTLAGSVLKMNKAIKNIIELGVPIENAIDFATKNPATLLNIIDRKGSIARGKDADFTVVDKDFNVLMTIREGNIIYKA